MLRVGFWTYALDEVWWRSVGLREWMCRGWDCFTWGRSMQYLGHVKSRWLLSLSWEPKWRTQSSPVQFWWCGLWRKPLLCSPLWCVPQCCRKDKACCPYGIDIPEVSVCVRATLWWSHSRQELHSIEKGSWLDIDMQVHWYSGYPQ